MNDLEKSIGNMGFDAEMRANLIEIVRISRQSAIEECLEAARSGFESSMKDYVLIGPSGMAMRMINSIRAVSPLPPSHSESK